MRNRFREQEAERTAQYLRRRLGMPNDHQISVGLVLGTGWGDALIYEDRREVPLKEIPNFHTLGHLEGHARTVVYGKVAGRDVLALRGRVHLNEAPSGEDIPRMVRLQVEMLFKLGVRWLILTNAAGSLKKYIRVGDIMMADGFVTLFAPPMPLWAGEFCSPEDAILPHGEIPLRVRMGLNQLMQPNKLHHYGGYAMVRGPFFEGRKYDKEILRQAGASVVGMSTLPEACVAALYGAKIVALSFVTNTDSEEHSHEENVARAKTSSQKLGKFLENLVTALLT